MAYLNTSKGKIFYSVTGDGEPLLLLHGNSVSSKLFMTVKRSYKKRFKTILFDFPGHGKSERSEKFDTDFWYSNSVAAYELLVHLGLKNVNVIGTSGGALVGINLALEHPEYVKLLIADSFEGAFPDAQWIKGLREERSADKKKLLAKLYWFINHGTDWTRVVDLDTGMNLEFAKEGRSFFHRNISELTVPALLTGSREDEFINNH